MKHDIAAPLMSLVALVVSTEDEQYSSSTERVFTALKRPHVPLKFAHRFKGSDLNRRIMSGIGERFVELHSPAGSCQIV